VAVAASLLLLGTTWVAQQAGAGSGTPAFTTYGAPAALANAHNAGEPSIGVDRRTGAMLYQAYASTYRVTVGADGVATWNDATASTSLFNIDPILATDAVTGRTFAGGLAGECSALAYSDDDGGTWTQETNACAGSFDHETIGSGPWAGTRPLTATYSRAVYYCAQNSVDSCITSGDGGLTFGAPVTVSGACSGLHGHVKVSADGTAYLPNSTCGGKVGGGITRSNGSTWTSYQVTPSTAPTRGFDPSVATTPNNTLYQAWMDGGTYHPMVGRSSDHGATWSGITDLASTVSPPIVASTFQSAVAGDDGRVAVAFLGTTTGSGVPFDNGYHGVWDLYVSTTYDGGATWTTVKASSDPVQRGCIWDGGGSNACRNLLDFMDASMTKDGRVVVGYADGCTGACATASGTEAQSTDAYATIAYQSSGRGLVAAYDSATSSSTTTTMGSSSTTATTAASTTTTVAPTTTTAPSTTTTIPSTTTTTAPSTDPDPSTPTLANGTPTSATSGASGSWQYYKVQVPAGATQLQVALSATQSCGLLSCNPDLDLYARLGARPTTSAYDASATTGSSSETITLANPTAGWWYLGVYVYSGSKALPYQITASVRGA
jgi:hypothetical protein